MKSTASNISESPFNSIFPSPPVTLALAVLLTSSILAGHALAGGDSVSRAAAGPKGVAAKPTEANRHEASRMAKDLSGPISDAYISSSRKKNVIVYGTGGKAEEVAGMKKTLKSISEWVKRDFNRDSDLVADTDFKPGWSDTEFVQFVGPMEHNSALKTFLRDAPVKVTPDSITVGTRTVTGKDLSLVMIWPQPGGREYVLIATGTSYAALEGVSNGVAGPTDFVVHSPATRKANSSLSFELMGNFDKSDPAKWKPDPEQMYLPAEARRFYSERAARMRENRRPPEAAIIDIEYRGGGRARGKLFRGDLENVLVKLYDSAGNPSGFMETPLNEIEKADGSSLIGLKVHRPDLNDQMQYVFWEIAENSRLLSRRVVSGYNNDDKTLEFVPLVSPEKIERVLDIFGNDIEFKGEQLPGNELQMYRARLNYPLRPGESIGLTIDSVVPGVVKPSKDGTFDLEYMVFCGRSRPIRLCILLPDGAELISVNPEAKTVNDTPRGRIVVLEQYITAAEALPIELTYRPGPEKK